MRIDQFLNSVNIVKRRAIAQDMIQSGVVFIDEVGVKASRQVKLGDVIEIRYLEMTKRYKVLQIPSSRTIPKSAKEAYVAEI